MGILHVQQIDLEIDLFRVEVKWRGEIIKMSRAEYATLALLASDPYALRPVSLLKEHARLQTKEQIYTLFTKLRAKFNGEFIYTYSENRDRETCYSLLDKAPDHECPTCRTTLTSDRYCYRCKAYKLGGS